MQADSPPSTLSSSTLFHFRFFGAVFVLASGRALLLHPLNIALYKRRCNAATTSSSSSSRTVSQELWAMLCDAAPTSSFSSSIMFRFRRLLHAAPILVASVGVSEAMYLTQMHLSRSWFQQQQPQWTDASLDFTAGLLGEGTRQLVNVPLAALGVRQLMHSSNTAHHFVGLRQVWKELGAVQSLTAGMALSLTVGPLWTASWWALYEYGKRRYASVLSQDGSSDSLHDNHSAASAAFVSALVASTSTAILFNPFLVVRSRAMQLGLRPRQVLAEIFQSKSHGGGGSATPTLLLRTLFAGLPLSVAVNVGEGLVAAATYETALAWAVS